MYVFTDIVRGFACKMCGTCCRNAWQVSVDKTSFQRNHELFQKTGRELEFRQAFLPLAGDPGEYAAIAKQPDGSCWFLDRDNLCRLQKEAGHSQLDAVCQTFPRYPMDTARGVEVTLSFSCPAVLELIDRNDPLTVLRTAAPPLPSIPPSFTAQVYPGQQPFHSALRYYFEIEQHFIDILQSRCLPLAARAALVISTAQSLLATPGDPREKINRLFNENYDRLYSRPWPGPRDGQASAEILAEHFLVNFVFKKPFYLYGLGGGSKLLELFVRRFAHGWQAAANAKEELAATKSIMGELEFEFGHNRQALLRRLADLAVGQEAKQISKQS